MAAKDCSVLVTGANRGLGLEMVRQFVEGAHPVRKLFACCRDPAGSNAEELQCLAKKHPDIINVVRLDVTNTGSIKKCAQVVGPLLGTKGLNLLVNNAAIAPHGSLETTSLEDMNDAFNTNVIGPMTIIKEFLPYLRAAAKASGKPGMSCCKAAVINISTILGSMVKVKTLYSFCPVISYCVSKAGLNMLTVCAEEEYRKDEILFALLHPGWVQTDMGGKEQGEISPSESVAGLLSVMQSLTEKQTGSFLDYTGKTVPW